MSLWRLITRSLCFYWRTNLGVLLAVMVSTAVLTGALVVGDSVRYSLMRMVDVRLGATQLALVSQNRFFHADLADDVSDELKAQAASVLQLRGIVANSDDTALANRVEVFGVDERFFEIGMQAGAELFWRDWTEGVVLNEPLAERLRVSVGDEVKLRIEKPGLMPREIPLTPDSDLSFFSRPIVRAVARESQFGRFSLQANQVAPLNVFVPIKWLQKNLEHAGQANVMLLTRARDEQITVEQANAAVRKRWRLADSGLEIRDLPKQGVLELRSRRIFIDQVLSNSAVRAADGAVGILTYFVNELRVAEKTTPYSTVAAMTPGGQSLVPARMGDDEILITQWLADDLDAKVGDTLELTYSILGPMRKLEDRKSSFKVRAILDMNTPGLDRELMPEFPGLADVDNCRDWKPGVTVDLDKIRDKDEAYWDDYRGTPKAVVTLEAGRKMWANRYGDATAVRYPKDAVSAKTVAAKLLGDVDPGEVGLFFQPVRRLGTKAGGESAYFGWLFLGLSFFLIAAAVVLTGLLFVFGVEGRSEQVGMLLALGFSHRLVRRLLFIEGGLVALLGSIAGTAAALLYTKIMILVLSTVTTGSTMYFHARLITLIAGAFSAVVISLSAIWLTLRGQVSRTARELLAGVAQCQFVGAGLLSRGRIGLIVAAIATAGALALPALVGGEKSGAVAGAFFGAGALLLIAAVALTASLLKIIAASWKRPMLSLAGLALRNCTRRRGRSLAVVTLLTCGVFLVIAVGVFRHDPLENADRRESGTGGFALFGESAIGILHDLNSGEGRRKMLLDPNILNGVEIVQLRVRDGDDASCFNLNRAQTPRLLGVRSDRLRNRGSFSFAATVNLRAGLTPTMNVGAYDSRTNSVASPQLYVGGSGDETAWDILNDCEAEDIVPAVGDYATIKWALGKSLGDDIEYSNEKGQKFKVRLVGTLENSILQGSLLIAEDQFIKRFGSEVGYRMLLIDAPQKKVDAVAAHLSGRLTDFGLDVSSARQRLAAFSEVENTYLSIFQILGGLGLVLGSIGLGLVVLRNMLERRNELAMLRAIGFNKAALKRMVFYEHSGLMLAGLAWGVIAALTAVAPAMKDPGAARAGYLSPALTVAAIALSGVVWIWIAAVLALSGEMLDALRSE